MGKKKNFKCKKKKKKPIKISDRLQELKNQIRGEMLVKVSCCVLAHAVISLWFRSRSGNANQNPACERNGGRSCREKGQTAVRLQMATLRRWGTFEAQEVKDSLFFQLSSVSGCTVWSLRGLGSGTTSGFADSLKRSSSLHLHVLRAKFRPPELVGRLRFLTDVGRQSSSPDRGGDKHCTFPGIQEVKLN